jgi:hypothetical protein
MYLRTYTHDDVMCGVHTLMHNMCAGMAAHSGGASSPADLAALASRVCCGPLPSNCCNRQVGFAESDQPSSGPNQRAPSLANRSERAYYSSRSLNAGEQGRYGECKKRSRPSLNPISLALLVLSLSWQIVVFHARKSETERPLLFRSHPPIRRRISRPVPHQRSVFRKFHVVQASARQTRDYQAIRSRRERSSNSRLARGPVRNLFSERYFLLVPSLSWQMFEFHRRKV